MLNVDYSRRLKSTGNYTTPMRAQGSDSFHLPKAGKPLSLFIGAIMLFTGGMVVGLHLNKTEEKYKINNGDLAQNSEIAFQNKSSAKSETKSEKVETKPVAKDSSIQDSPAFFPKNLKFPPKMDQINYVIEIGAFEPGESSRIGKLILSETNDFQGRIFRTSTGKLFAGYFYKQEDAKRALETLRSFEKDDFTDAEIKTVRF
jgi:hypothetical protein